MKKKYVVIIHSLYWLYRGLWGPIGYWLVYGKAYPFSKMYTPLTINFLLLSVVIFYINYLFILPRFFKRNKIGKLLLGWLTLIGFWTLLRYCVEEIAFPKLLGIRNYTVNTKIGFYIFDNLFYAFPLIGVGTFIWMMVNLINAEKEKTLLQAEKRKAEVSFLRSQVNPHFIFNTLNNIYSLVYHQSPKSLPAIENLSHIMRYQMKENETDKVELQKEIDYLKNYIDLQSIRIKDNAKVNFDVEGNANSKWITPLILLPFVENGFKHGDLNNNDYPFRIAINIDGDQLTFFCSNKILEGTKDHSSGIGLQNVRKRLDLLYPGRYELNTESQNGLYSSTLILDLQNGN